eukprot:m.216917 g.216917  ORF g.216917 m.216917 type:complete len:63 (-) comp33219_c1_seq13:2993-3181(-)
MIRFVFVGKFSETYSMSESDMSRSGLFHLHKVPSSHTQIKILPSLLIPICLTVVVHLTCLSV